MDELWMYKVKVIYWDVNCKKREDNLIVAAESMADSVKKVCDYYGDERIENIGSTIIEETQYGIMVKDTKSV